MQEREEKKILLPDDNPVNIARMILWVYYDRYSIYAATYVEGGNECYNAPSLCGMLKLASDGYERLGVRVLDGTKTGDLEYVAGVHLEMYELADKYDIPLLRDEAVRRLDDMMVPPNESMFKVFWAVEGYAGAAQIGCQPLTEMLHKTRMRELSAFCENDRFEEQIKKNGELAWNILKETVKTSEALRKAYNESVWKDA